MPLLLTALGLICILAGYRLFCGLPARHYSQLTVFTLNILPGALLALFGAGLLTAQARALVVHHPPTHRVAWPQPNPAAPRVNL
jgi:hypothetical protein